ncbi:DUF4231 domain-containing protein [Shewanella frigidimarina]|jgi:hypothetical protein|uniref:DUF4231 domain-containing protein n=1 Tax=Shewanella frigidimarina TaxID=56812 RepID=UPI000F4D9BAD|nr:DUF4231 domain-containing protein [Shewanella frigidimarina]RPA58868.1 DUF4231 domain-containing protein [Shewanella frigidimarina]
MSSEEKEATSYCQEKIEHFKAKAAHNKAETLWCFRLIMISTLLVPLFVGLGTEVWISKGVPSFLSGLAAFCTAWIQLRKPQELWTLYRTTQRELEDQLTQFNYRFGDYDSSDDTNKLLAQNVAKLTLQTHHKWMPIVPSPDKFPSDLKSDPSKAE